MRHFLLAIVYAACLAAFFASLLREDPKPALRVFYTIFGTMVGGVFVHGRDIALGAVAVGRPTATTQRVTVRWHLRDSKFMRFSPAFLPPSYVVKPRPVADMLSARINGTMRVRGNTSVYPFLSRLLRVSKANVERWVVF